MLSEHSRIAAALDAQRRLARFSRRVAPGFLGGRTEAASPVSPAAHGIATPTTRPDSAGAGGGVDLFAVQGSTAGAAGLQTFAPDTHYRIIEYDTVTRSSPFVTPQGGSDLGWFDIAPGIYTAHVSVWFYLVPAASGRIDLRVSCAGFGDGENLIWDDPDFGTGEIPVGWSLGFVTDSPGFWLGVELHAPDADNDIIVNRANGGLQIVRHGDLPD